MVDLQQGSEYASNFEYARLVFSWVFYIRGNLSFLPFTDYRNLTILVYEYASVLNIAGF